MIKRLLCLITALSAIMGNSLAVEPQSILPVVSDVTMRQIPYTRDVEITYNLSQADAIITLGIETNGVAIPDNAVTHLEGDVCRKVEAGDNKRIIWHAGIDWPENLSDLACAKVTAYALDSPPQYAAVDVTDGTAAEKYPVYFYPSAEGVPGGVTNNRYKTVCMLLRRIEPTGGEGFTMGSPSNETGRNASREAQKHVILTKPYFMGVYQVTQQQWQQVMGDIRSWPSKWNNNDYRLTRPVEQVSYFEARENPNSSAVSPNWPESDVPGSNSFMGRLCAKAGEVLKFDLPTEAQWEWACRAGTTGALNDGTVNVTGSSDPNLDLLGRYERNGGKVESDGKYSDPPQNCTTEHATAAVGSYLPNAWGLYDMHGNVWEWCLDWFADALPGGTDPVGAASGSIRVLRGGSWSLAASLCRSAYRHSYAPSSRNRDIGLRVAAAPGVSF